MINTDNYIFKKIPLKSYLIIVICVICVLFFTATTASFAQLTANFSANSVKGCNTLLVNFSDISAGGVPTTWSWNFGDGNTSALKNPTNFYATSGIYNVTLTVSDGTSSNTVTKTGFISVFALPATNFTQTTATGCTPFTLTFTDASTGSSAITSWLWNFGDATTSTLQNPVKTYTAAGAYTVILFAKDTNGCDSTKTKNALVNVFDGPKAGFSVSDTASCTKPFTVSVTNSSTGAGLSYNWNFGDGDTSTAPNPAPHTYLNLGSFTLKLVVTSTNGCKDSISRTIRITQFDTDFTFSPSSGCPPFVVNYNDTSNATTAWTWSFTAGSPPTSSSKNPSITYNTPGTYSTSLIATNALGCNDTISKINIITVHPLPVPVFSVSDSETCVVPLTVTFTDNTTGVVSRSWSFPGGTPATSSTSNQSVTYNSPGLYNVSITTTDGNGCTNTLTKSNYIKIIEPVANFTASPLFGCIPLNVNFTDQTISNELVTSWQWNFGDGTPVVTGLNPSHTYGALPFDPNDTGQFTVTLIITNAKGCTDTVTKTNFVSAGMIPTADFSPKDTSGCHPFQVPFTNLSGTYTTSWLWDFGPAGTSTQFNPTQTFTDTGYFNVMLIASHYGCPDTITDDSVVYTRPAKAIFTAIPTILCDTPYTVAFADTSKAAMQWTWKFGDGTQFTGKTPPPHTYTIPAFYTVWLIVGNDTSGCIDSISTLIRISDIKPGFRQDTAVSCQPAPITFTDTSSTNTSISGIQWNFGDGISTPGGTPGNTITGVSNTSGTFSNPNHIFNNAGIYTLLLTITDQLGCTKAITAINRIEVKDLPKAGFITDTTANGCPPLEIGFIDTSKSSTTLVSWKWDFGDSVTDSVSGDTTIHSYLSKGDYTVSLTVRDTFNCSNIIVKSNLVKVTKPVPAFTFPDSVICDYSNVTFTNNSAGSALKYQWNFGDSTAIDSTVNPVHFYGINKDTTTVLTVTLFAVDSNGCDSNLTKNITVSIPVADFKFDTTGQRCAPFNVAFNDSSSTDVTGWNWDLPGSNTPTASIKNPNTVYLIPGKYNATLIATNSDVCKDTMTKDSVIVVQGPSGTFTVTPDAITCNQQYIFTATVKNTTKLDWVFGEGGTGNKTTEVFRYSSAGTKTPLLHLEDSVSKCNFDISQSLVIPAVPLTAKLIADTLKVFPEVPITFTNQSVTVNTIISTTWNYSDGKTDTTLTEQQRKHTYYTVGTYVVKIVVKDNAGCIDSASVKVEVVEGLAYSNVFTPNGDGLNDVFEVKNNGLKMHELSIFNRWGQLMYEQKAPEVQWFGTSFAGEPVPAGTYYFVLISEYPSGNITTNKGFLTLIR